MKVDSQGNSIFLKIFTSKNFIFPPQKFPSIQVTRYKVYSQTKLVNLSNYLYYPRTTNIRDFLDQNLVPPTFSDEIFWGIFGNFFI